MSNDNMSEVLNLSEKLTTHITFHEIVRIGEYTDKTAYLYNDDFELSFEKLSKTHVAKKEMNYPTEKKFVADSFLNLLIANRTPQKKQFKKDEIAVGYKRSYSKAKIEHSDNEDATHHERQSKKSNTPKSDNITVLVNTKGLQPLFKPILDLENGIPFPPGLPLPSPFFNAADYFEMRIARTTRLDLR